MSMMQQSLRETYNAIPSVGVLNVLGLNALDGASESLRIYDRRVDIVCQIIDHINVLKDLGILPAVCDTTATILWDLKEPTLLLCNVRIPCYLIDNVSTDKERHVLM